MNTSNGFFHGGKYTSTSCMDPMGLVITGLKKPSRVWQHLPPGGRGEIIDSSSCQLVICW